MYACMKLVTIVFLDFELIIQRSPMSSYPIICSQSLGRYAIHNVSFTFIGCYLYFNKIKIDEETLLFLFINHV